MRHRTAAVVAALALALGLAACGGERSSLTPVEQNQLLGLIAKARSEAAAGNSSTALSTLTTLRNRVSTLRRAGALDPQSAAHMQSVAAQAQSAARARIASAVKPAPAPAVVTTPAAPSNPVQIVIQDAKGLQQRAQNALRKGAAKLKDKINKLRKGGAGHGGKGD